MYDLISRQAAIELIESEYRRWGEEYEITDVLCDLGDLPTAEPTLYGYKIEHLAYIATVMEKEGVTAEYAVRTFDDIGRVIKMLIEEVQAKVEEVLK